jgi:mannose-6-phosphate isomerase-like protein (cupin superfamily)
VRSDRPWGYYEIIETRDVFQIKYLVVFPGKRLSLQSHQLRAENWHVISGLGVVTVNSESFQVGPGDSVSIPIGAIHRVAANTDTTLTFVEIQTGTSFDESDIVRHEDDFGRVSN